MKMKRCVSVLLLGAVITGCAAAPQGTPVDATDPLAATCPGITTEMLDAFRVLYGGFADKDLPIEDAQAAAQTGCEQNPYPGADLDTCSACLNAVIDEAYGQ